jgi:putative ribosome biogenesis GTPase RsgA
LTLIIICIAQYVDYASQEVVDQLKAPALILAENLPADVTEYTMMIVGRNGIGKSCLVNETLKLAPEERLLEGISKTSHGKLSLQFLFRMRC